MRRILHNWIAGQILDPFDVSYIATNTIWLLQHISWYSEKTCCPLWNCVGTGHPTSTCLWNLVISRGDAVAHFTEFNSRYGKDRYFHLGILWDAIWDAVYLPLKLGHGCIITSHYFMLMYKITYPWHLVQLTYEKYGYKCLGRVFCFFSMDNTSKLV